MAIQATGSLLDGCVLSLLMREDAYGYSLTQQVKSTLSVSESTLYPVMRRLQTDDCLSVYDVPHNGRNRRYYKITDRGRIRCNEAIGEWQEFKQRVDEIMVGPGMMHIEAKEPAGAEPEIQAEIEEHAETVLEPQSEGGVTHE